MLKRVFLLAFLFALFWACTERTDLAVEQIADTEQITERSTQAECDSIEADVTPNVSCTEAAELLECRLNQGINESVTAASCELIDTYDYTECIDIDLLLSDYETIVNRVKNEVAENTDDCGGGCVNPSPIWGCRIILFTVSYTGNVCDPSGDCEMDIDADVYCCD